VGILPAPKRVKSMVQTARTTSWRLGALGTLANLSDGARSATIESKTNLAAPVGSRITGDAVPLHALCQRRRDFVH